MNIKIVKSIISHCVLSDEEAEDGEGVEDEGRVINHHGKPMKVGPEPTDPKVRSFMDSHIEIGKLGFRAH